MTAIVRLTRAELRKLATTRTALITLAIAIALSVISVVATAVNAGKHGTPALGTDAGTYAMLKVGVVSCLAMIVLGVIAAGGEYRHRTIIPAMLTTPSRGALVAAKTIAIAIAGVVLAGLTFGVSLATELFGLIGVALGYITRSTIAAVVGAVGWLLIAEMAILGTAAPQLGKWLIYGTARVLTNPPGANYGLLAPGTAAAVLAGYTVALLATAAWLVRRRDAA